MLISIKTVKYEEPSKTKMERFGEALQSVRKLPHLDKQGLIGFLANSDDVDPVVGKWCQAYASGKCSKPETQKATHAGDPARVALANCSSPYVRVIAVRAIIC